MSKIINTDYPITDVAGIAVNTSLHSNPGNYVGYDSRTVTYIVVHYTGNEKDTAWANANYFANGNRDAGAHYFVDDTTIYQSVRACDAAGHVGNPTYWHPYCRNANSIGIEMCCSGNYKVSDKTKANTVALVAAWCRELGYGPEDVDDYVLRHYDVSGKMCPMQMAGHGNAEWQAFKDEVKVTLGGEIEEYDDAVLTLPTLHFGSKGKYVKTLQVLLNFYASAEVNVDGNFDQDTKLAVMGYQRCHDLEDDGIVGPMTWAVLLG